MAPADCLEREYISYAEESKVALPRIHSLHKPGLLAKHFSVSGGCNAVSVHLKTRWLLYCGG